MSKPEITAEFLTAGKARFLVSNAAGVQYTFRIKRWDSKKTGKTFYFVDAQERSQWMEFVKMGTMTEDGQFIHGGDRAEVPVEHIANAVFQWAITQIIEQNDLPEGYSMKHCGACARCGRPLSVEESVVRGIGPDCYGKMVKESKRVKIMEGVS